MASVSVVTSETGARRRRAARVTSIALVGAGALGAVVSIAGVLQSAAFAELPSVLLPLAWLVAATFAVVARPDHRGAVLFLGLGVTHCVGGAAGVLLSYLGCLGLFLATFPTGRASTRAEQWFARLVFPVVLAVSVFSLLTSDPLPSVVEGPRPAPAAPAGLPLVRSPFDAGPLVALVVVVGVVLFVLRARRLRDTERRQLSWAVVAGGLLALMLLASPAVSAISPHLQSISFVVVAGLVPFALLAGLVRFRLMEVDLYLTRTLARGIVVVVVLSLYALLTWASERLGSGAGNLGGWAPGGWRWSPR